VLESIVASNRWYGIFEDDGMQYMNTRIGDGGRLVIPAEFRKALGMHVGDDVILALGDGELRILTRLEAIRRAQERVRPYVRAGESLADELVAERRAEAARE
jgi:AbrB family looped-hinge helix DNA binding protein